MRVGLGYDVHRFKEGSEVVLGGVRIPHNKTLDGHSDADVLTHALIDALLGASGLKDIGTYFPDSDSQYKGADSIELLKNVMQLVNEAGFKVVNVDSVFVAEAPKLKPYVDKIKENLSDVLGVQAADVGVKATTSERVGFIGREEAAASHCVVLLEKNV